MDDLILKLAILGMVVLTVLIALVIRMLVAITRKFGWYLLMAVILLVVVLVR